MLQATEITPDQIETANVYMEMGLSEQEYQWIKSMLNRRPNLTETGIFSVMWSEHCSYKRSKSLLKRFPTEARHVLQGPGEGAGIIDIGDEQAVVFKVESHNHPSAVEPYNGAATGVGGIVRDVFSMGARPVALLNSLRFGHLQTARNKRLFQEVVRGMTGYGHGICVPVISGEAQFGTCYEANPLVNAMCVGLINHNAIQKGIAAGVGNTVIYAGATTRRDGIHGATFASGDLATDAADQISQVPAGDPLVEKNLIEACLEAAKSDALVGMQDMGAAGLASSASEMADKAGTGIDMNLDLVPKQDNTMSAYELMLSESQERMLLVVQKGREQEILDMFAAYKLQAAVIGEVIEEKSFRLRQHGDLVATIPVDALTDKAPVYPMRSEEAAYFRLFQQMACNIPQVTNYGAMLKTLLEWPSIASKEWVYEPYDTDTENHTVIEQGSDAGVIGIEGTTKALAMTTDCNAGYIYLDPETGGKIAVAKAARNIVCTGAKPLAMTDGLNFGNPANSEIYWQMEKSVAGISEACRMLRTPVISGNVSLNNESDGKAIFPTPIVGMVGLMESLEHLTPRCFQRAGDAIYLIGGAQAEFGGSALQQVLHGAEENEGYTGRAPIIDLATEAKRQEQLLEAIRSGVVQSAHTVAEGGLAVALAESCFTEQELGATLYLNGDLTVDLFSETQSRFLVSVSPEHEARFKELVGDSQYLGTVTAHGMYTIMGHETTIIEESVATLRTHWKGAIPCLLNVKE